MKIVTKEKAENTRNRILGASKDLFYTKGYSKVTMDDIAQKLAMSKKTLYRYFENKYDIISQIVQNFIDDLGNGVKEIVHDDSLEYPFKLKKMLNFVAVKLSGISVLLLEDMQTTLPELWHKLDQFKKESAFIRFNQLIEEGREKSMINQHINHRLIVALYASAIHNLLNPDFIRQLPAEIVKEMPAAPSDIFDNIINIIYEGILTEETKEKFRKEEGQ